MAYVIAEPCIGTRTLPAWTCARWTVSIRVKTNRSTEGVTQLYINPTECLSTGGMRAVCPVTAIFALEDLPEKWQAFGDELRSGTRKINEE